MYLVCYSAMTTIGVFYCYRLDIPFDFCYCCNCHYTYTRTSVVIRAVVISMCSVGVHAILVFFWFHPAWSSVQLQNTGLVVAVIVTLVFVP